MAADLHEGIYPCQMVIFSSNPIRATKSRVKVINELSERVRMLFSRCPCPDVCPEELTGFIHWLNPNMQFPIHGEFATENQIPTLFDLPVRENILCSRRCSGGQ